MPTSTADLAIAMRIVADSCRVARSVQAVLERVKKVTKDDRSPVTVADFAVQAIVAMELLEHDADARIVGEEHADELRRPDRTRIFEAVVDAVRSVRPSEPPSAVLEAIDHCDHDGASGSYWTLDPIDGTKGFLRGQQYAIALARIEDGRVTLGVMGCPNLSRDEDRPFDDPDPVGTIYAATLGGGTTEFAVDDLDGAGTPVRLGDRAPDAPVRACESVEAAHSKHDDTQRILDALGGAGTPARLDSQCKYAVVARGQADAYLRLPTKKGYVEKIWDHAAGSLIAMEAGAVVTDVFGTRLDFTHGRRLEQTRGIICATPDLHGRIIEAIRDLGLGTAG